MARLNLAISTGLAVVFAVSCTKSGVDNASTAPSETVVTKQRADEEVRLTQNQPQLLTDADVAYAPAAPPPPPAMIASADPSAGIVVTSQRRAESLQGVALSSRHAKIASASGAMPYPRQDPYVPRGYHDVGRDKFTAVAQNPFKLVREEPVSTFSIDVDTASYSFVRASLNRNVMPQPAAVRTEEMVNYFPYNYAPPRNVAQPFSTNVAVFPSPWKAGRKLVRVGIRGYAIQRQVRPRANLVFLIDTSGSMNEPNKLPLVKQSLIMLLDQLSASDRVAIVTYAGSAGTALEPTPASQKAKIRAVIDQLGAYGSTAGAEGIRQAYNLAEQNLDPKGVNRVILATDGDFNVGITNDNELKGFVERERGKGVFLSVLGFGMGNYNDALMQTLAQNGNGTAAYIDNVNEARKVLVEEATSTLFTIAKDVKIQVEFNPTVVAEYRLIGYETRMLNRDDFDNDKVDAGDVGSGQTVTALYEITPVGGPRAISNLRYQMSASAVPQAVAGEYGYVKIRYKLPKSDTSKLISTPINSSVEVARFDQAPQDARFATGVAAFAELLKGGRYNGTMNYDDVLNIATAARGNDSFGYRSEFIQLVRAAKTAGSLARLEQ